MLEWLRAMVADRGALAILLREIAIWQEPEEFLILRRGDLAPAVAAELGQSSEQVR